MTRIFKQDFPHMILNQAQQETFHQSFLEEMLRVNYSEVMENFFNFNFASIGHFSKFVARILKLTRILLEKFDSGNAVMKSEIKQKNPRFDSLLNVIHKYLNKAKFTMIIETLELQEIRGLGHKQCNIRQAFISNKFLA